MGVEAGGGGHILDSWFGRSGWLLRGWRCFCGRCCHCGGWRAGVSEGWARLRGFCCRVLPRLYKVLLAVRFLVGRGRGWAYGGENTPVLGCQIAEMLGIELHVVVLYNALDR